MSSKTCHVRCAIPIIAVASILVLALPTARAATFGIACNESGSSDWAGFEVSFWTTLLGGGNPTPPYTYYWDFGDGASSTLAAPTHAFTTYGSFKVVVSMRDANGNTGTDSCYIGISTLASITSVSFDKTSYQEGDTMQFTIQAQAGRSPSGAYRPIAEYWANVFTNGQSLLDSTSTSPTFSVQVMFSGTVKIQVAAYDQYGNPSGVKTVYVDFARVQTNPGSNPNPSPSPASIDYSAAIVASVVVVAVALLAVALTLRRRRPPAPPYPPYQPPMPPPGN